MSFLNSVLSSIGSDEPKIFPPVLKTDRQNGGNSGQDSTARQTPNDFLRNRVVQSNKRRADDTLAPPNGKTQKLVGVFTQTAASLRQSYDASTTTNKIPYRGTSKPTARASPAPPPPTATPTNVGNATKAPKKGSYAEIMARAAAAQSKPQIAGSISHKPKDKIAISYKKELKELKQQKKGLKDKKLGIKNAESRPSSSDGKSNSPASGKSAKKAVQVEYKGTANPKSNPKSQPTYKGTMAPVSTADKKGSPQITSRRHPSKHRLNEYAATDDELEEVGESGSEDEGYRSEDSDDMEAGFSDVEEEESAAVRAARKEDEEEAMLEAKLKKEKEGRRKKLELMAKNAKPRKY